MGCNGSKATTAPKSDQKICLEVSGKIGAVINYVSGHIDEVLADSQAERLGVQKGWQVILVEDEPYNRERLEKKVASETPFRLTFLKASATLLQEPEAAESKALKKEPEAADSTVSAREPEAADSTSSAKQETQEPVSATLLLEPTGASKALEKELEPAEDSKAPAKQETQEPAEKLDVAGAAEKKDAVGESALPEVVNAGDAAKSTESQDKVGAVDNPSVEAVCAAGETPATKAEDPVAADRIIQEPVTEAEIVEDTVPEGEIVQAKAPWKCICAGFA